MRPTCLVETAATLNGKLANVRLREPLKNDFLCLFSLSGFPMAERLFHHIGRQR